MFNSKMTLHDRVASFDERRYRFVDFNSLGDFPPPQHSPERIKRDRDRANRHEQRSRYFFEPLVRLYGGSLKGHRVLDLACNAGFWSLKAIEAGADYVLGVDGRDIHIDHANLVFEAAGIDNDRYRFEEGNVLELSPDPTFDIVLCLGLLYHVAKPVDLFEVMAEAQMLVIDTEVSLLPGSAFEVGHEDLEDRKSAIDYELVLWPTRQAVMDLASQFDFKSVPLALTMSDRNGMAGYIGGHRLAFFCAKDMDLSGLPKETPPLLARSGIKADVARFGHSVLRRGHVRSDEG
jgi:SAM-dependent methyltransferase